MLQDMNANSFERARKAFRLLGKEFYFQFIPSIHFQDLLRQIIELLLLVDRDALTTNAESDSTGGALQLSVLTQLRTLLEEKAYQILHDVLLYQNDERVDFESLKYRTSPLEIAEFVALLISDDEVLQALEVVTSGLGKLLAKINGVPLSATTNSTPSS